MTRRAVLAVGLIVAALAACDGDESLPDRDGAAADPDARPADARPPDGGDADPDAAAPPDARPDGLPDAAVDPGTVQVLVLLDGEPAPDTRVVQGGTQIEAFTDAEGRATLELDLSVVGDIMVVASHPRARQRGEWLFDGIEQPVVLPLTSFGPDNPEYRFQDPGEPRRRNTTAQCGHCHLTINDAWFGSAHQQAASNPIVHDLYAGTAAAIDDPETCAERGGTWGPARVPGRDDPGERCYIGAGLLPAINAECAEGPCLEPAAFGGCADCHAPAINGQLGGRDLLAARDVAFDYGISCDVCHRVEAVLDEGEPGVAGRLALHRPSDPGPITLGAGGVLPLTFGPSHDSPNPRMGSVQRDHYRNARICSGCHQHDAPPLVGEADRARWPDGVLPIQSTWAEWQAGPLAEVPCQSCHMPPEPGAANSADLQAFLPAALVGIQGGWFRPPGAVRRHRWTGPRVADTLPRLAATVKVAWTREGDRLDARVTTRNAGAGHAIPTGEAMRQMLLTVDATCADDTPLPAIDGDAVPAWGGAVAARADGWDRWPAARVGDVIRVVRRTGEWHDYPGVGPFGDGTFDPRQKGLPVERVVGAVTVIAVDDGQVELDRPLPDGDVAYLVRDDALAGRAGFGFARLMVDDAGAVVPHFLATDVQSDNRLMPQARWTSTHVFDAAGCEAPRVHARLLYRAWPWALGRERGWAPRAYVMAEEIR